jgi:phosphoglycolate phosphatase
MKLAIFDVDGTLVNSRAMITSSLTAAFRSEGLLPPDEQQMLSIVGLSLADAMQKLVPDEEPQRHESLAAAYKSAFWDYRASNTNAESLFDGALELLERLRSRTDVMLGLATGKSRRGVNHLVERHNFEGWFATIQTADDHPSKPHPSMLLQALAETGLEPHEAAMIGDTSYDMSMARSAGVGAIGVTWGNHPRDEIERSGAHYVVSDFHALEVALERMWQTGGR